MAALGTVGVPGVVICEEEADVRLRKRWTRVRASLVRATRQAGSPGVGDWRAARASRARCAARARDPPPPLPRVAAGSQARGSQAHPGANRGSFEPNDRQRLRPPVASRRTRVRAQRFVAERSSLALRELELRRRVDAGHAEADADAVVIGVLARRPLEPDLAHHPVALCLGPPAAEATSGGPSRQQTARVRRFLGARALDSNQAFRGIGSQTAV